MDGSNLAVNLTILVEESFVVYICNAYWAFSEDKFVYSVNELAKKSECNF